MRIPSLSRTYYLSRTMERTTCRRACRMLLTSQKTRISSTQRFSSQMAQTEVLQSSSRRTFASQTTKKQIHSSASQKHSTATMDFTHSVPPPASSSSALNQSAQNTPRPNFAALKALFIASACPMMGFGFMDNFVMIQAGQYIDSTIGVQLGLATMTAAAAGQVVSDVSGVVFGGTLERLMTRFSLMESPPLSMAQRQLPICRNVAMAGAVVGVIIGCALGATTLLLVDLEARHRIQRAVQLREVVTDLITGEDHEAGIRCEAATVYLADHSGGYDFEKLQDPEKWRTHLELLKKAKSSTAKECAKKREVMIESHSQILYVPVVKDDELLAVVEFRHSRDSKDGEFSDHDVRTAEIMANHMSIFMEHLCE